MMSALSKVVKYVLYPALLALTMAIIWAAIHYQWNYKKVYGLTTVFLLISLVCVESLFPFQRKWSMTRKSFLRDLKYIAVGAPMIAITKTAFGIWAISYSSNHSPLLSHTPIWIEALAFLLVFEFFQYWYHRLSHEAQGPFGQFLWRVHASHHLPDRVYVVMHAVFHPINIVIATAIIQGSLVLLGISPEAALAATLLIDLQSLVSHFNVDLRAGFLNYIFIGTETHRTHHGAIVKDGGNYGNTLAIWDLLFGTFRYKPGVYPERLGVEDPEAYPNSNEWAKVMTLPFRSLSH
jgi:sterol desaturase/sphingolipid hydroxylase (fatty acid hydroxylase superfamily)